MVGYTPYILHSLDLSHHNIYRKLQINVNYSIDNRKQTEFHEFERKKTTHLSPIIINIGLNHLIITSAFQ